MIDIAVVGNVPGNVFYLTFSRASIVWLILAVFQGKVAFFHTNQFSILVHPQVTTKDNLCIYQNFLSVQLSDTVILPRTLKFLLFKVKILCVQTIEILLLMCFPIFIHVLSFDFQTQPTASFPACGLVLSGSSLLQSMERNASEIYFGQNVDISLLK